MKYTPNIIWDKVGPFQHKKSFAYRKNPNPFLE